MAQGGQKGCKRFNPCFIGLASATPPCVHNFSGILRFQSLFYWISLCDHQARVTALTGKTGFNPCFIGLASATIYIYIYISSAVLFQSLFYWISLCDFYRHWGRYNAERFQSLFYWISLCDAIPFPHIIHGIFSFNPCFIGLASAT